MLLLSLTVSAVLAEIAFRVLRPAPYADPKIVKPDGSSVPMSEMASMLPKSGEQANGQPAGPHGRIKPDWHIKHCYDRPAWPYFDREGCVSVDINSLGFRDLEFPVEKPKGELRILTIGDSFTFGSGVQLADSWPQVLEEMLEEERQGPVEVINGGYAAGSHWPPGYVDWLASDGVAFQPDVVILGFCLNDMSVKVPMLAYPRAHPQPWLAGVSELLCWFQTRAAQQQIEEQRFDYAKLIELEPESAGSWEMTKTACRQMRDTLAARGIRFVVAVFPMLSELGEKYPYLGLHELVRKFCEAEGIERVDLLPRFRNHDDVSLWVHPVDQHPNHVGNRMIAEGIHEYLRLHK